MLPKGNLPAPNGGMEDKALVIPARIWPMVSNTGIIFPAEAGESITGDDSGDSDPRKYFTASNPSPIASERPCRSVFTIDEETGTDIGYFDVEKSGADFASFFSVR